MRSAGTENAKERKDRAGASKFPENFSRKECRETATVFSRDYSDLTTTFWEHMGQPLHLGRT